MQTQMAIEEKFTLAVFDLIHENLQPSVASYFGSGPSFSVEEVEGFSFMDAKHWVSWISLGFGHATLCMRIHYKAEEIRSLMATRIHKNVNHIPELLVKDVMGEFLNIFSATFKSEFALLDPRVSVPRCRSGNERERASIHMIDRNSATLRSNSPPMLTHWSSSWHSLYIQSERMAVVREKISPLLPPLPKY